VATWRLPVVGVMGDEPLDEVRKAFDQTNEALRSIGCELSSPILSLSFIALPTIPAYGLSDRGLFDVQAQRFVDIIVPD
jgi:adenine deaminase